jgi:Protein of unknown function (DUF3887)
VKDSLTIDGRNEYLYTIDDASGAVDPVAIRVRDTARRLIRELTSTGTGSPLEAVAAARELSAAADASLQAAVDRARSAGHSWREIGDVLDTTRQAAFQRFGHPVDPRTGRPMILDVLPGAADRAVRIFVCFTEGRWEDARRDFGERVLQAVDADRLARGWAQTIGMVGDYERMGEPLVYPVEDATAVDVPLYFEAGERTGRVVFDRDGKVVGLWLRPAQA